MAFKIYNQMFIFKIQNKFSEWCQWKWQSKEIQKSSSHKNNENTEKKWPEIIFSELWALTSNLGNSYSSNNCWLSVRTAKMWHFNVIPPIPLPNSIVAWKTACSHCGSQQSGSHWREKSMGGAPSEPHFQIIVSIQPS